MHSVVIYLIGSALFLSMIFPDSIAAITYSSLGLNSNKYAPTSESYIRDKYGLRSNLQSCLTKLSNPKGMDCKGRDKGCCLLIKLSVQRKSAMKKVNRPENKNTSIMMSQNRKDKYRSFWDEDQKFDFPRIIETKQLENKNDIIQRVADGKSDFENLEQSTIVGKTKNKFISSSFNDETEMNEVTDEHDSDPIDVSNENIFTNNHYGFEQTTKRSFKTDGDADNREDNFSKGQVDDVDEKVFLKWALEKRKKEYENIKKRKSENPSLKPKLDFNDLDRATSSIIEEEKDVTSIKTGPKSLPKNNPSNNEIVSKEPQNLFLGGQRRGVIKKNNKIDKSKKETMDMETSASSKKKNMIKSITNYFLKNRKKHWKKKHKNKSDAYPKFSQRYDRPHCATLKVPCRFVSDHACCRFKMPLDLVARARSMDGSADLKWRNADHSLAYNIGGPRSAAQGRSLDWKTKNGANQKAGLNQATKFSSSISPRNVKYNYANTKHSVSIPRYFYKGGPIQIKNLLATCWRLHYLKCPGKNWQASLSMKKDRNDKLKEHPCCKLVSRPVSASLPSNRISRWLS